MKRLFIYIITVMALFAAGWLEDKGNYDYEDRAAGFREQVQRKVMILRGVTGNDYPDGDLDKW